MNRPNFFATACKIAWRESRASTGKFLFVIFAVAIGVGSLTGVRGFSQALAGLLLREARTLLGADVAVRPSAPLTTAQKAVLEQLERSGNRITHVTETLTMAGAPNVNIPVPVSLKAVDPRVFPFYGAVTTDPQRRLSDMLAPDSVVISDDLRIRLNTGPGSVIRIGGMEFRVAGIVTAEPDRLASGPAFGPRVLISRQGLDRSSLIQLGSRAGERYLIRLAPTESIAKVRSELKGPFEETQISDYREINANVTKALDDATSFLSLVSLIALIVGAIGVATAMHAHLQQKMDSIAIMKSMGARSWQIIQIYAIQTLMLGLVGGICGVAVGSAVQHIFPAILIRYFQVSPDIPLLPSSAWQGLAAGLLTTLLFTLPTLLSIRQVKPGLIFRRDMAEAKQPWLKRLSAAKASILSGFVIVLGIAGLASWLVSGTRQEATRFGLVFIGGLLVSLVVLAGVAWLLLYLLRVFVRFNRSRLPTSLRHGIANLYRPGTHAESILTALGIGVMFTLTVYLVQRSVLSEIIRNSPPGMANVFMLDISEQQRGQMAEMLAHHPAVEGDFELIGTVSANIRSINGTPIDQIQNITPGRRRGLAFRRIVTSYDKLPKGITVEEGKWWNGQPAEPQVSLYKNLAKYLNVQPGSVIEWNAFGRQIRTRVVSIHATDPHRLAARIDIIFSPGALTGLPTIYYGAVRAKPTQVATLQRDAYAKFPTVTVLNMADIIERVQEVVEQVTFVIRFISLFAILAGATILASSVAGTRFRRVREVVILKTLGATRGRVARIFSAEFLILGTVAGLMGSILASFFTMVVLTRLMKLQFHFDPLPNLISIALTALIAAAAGWLASFRILGQKPLEVLRGE